MLALKLSELPLFLLLKEHLAHRLIRLIRLDVLPRFIFSVDRRRQLSLGHPRLLLQTKERIAACMK
jgi:hypothetical protein